MRHPTCLDLIALGALALAGLVAVASFAGLVVPAVYANETRTWSAQGMGLFSVVSAMLLVGFLRPVHHVRAAL